MTALSTGLDIKQISLAVESLKQKIPVQKKGVALEKGELDE